MMHRSLSHRRFQTSQLGATTNYALAVSPNHVNAPVIIRRIRCRWLSGTAANWRGYLFSSDISGAPAGDLTWEWDGTAKAVTVVVDAVVELHTKLDSLGNLYFRGNPDAGTGNVFDVWLDLEF
jgi:hypothetical protein